MRPRGRVWLRNKIISFLNSKPQLGCKVFAGVTPAVQRARGKQDQYFSRLITGIARDGRMIVIYPIIHWPDRIPKAVCKYMGEVDALCGIVGTASNIGEAWDIVICDEKEYPRTERTRLHNYLLKKSEKKNGKSSDSEE